MIEFLSGEKGMKKIYTFTLESDDYPSDSFRYNLRLIAHFLYGYIYNYDGEDTTPLNINKNIRINNLYEYGRTCYLDSDEYDDGFINYEPFLIGNRSFGLTVNDELISEEIIKNLIDYVLRMLGVNYKVTIHSVTYHSKNVDDESKRWKAIKIVTEEIGYRFNRKFNLVKRLINGSRNNTNFN